MIVSERAYAPLPGAPPVIVPSMAASCSYAVALAALAAPSALRGRLRFFAMTREGGAPHQWKRRATEKLSAFRAWARTNPGAELAARTGCTTGLAVVQAADADALAAAEACFGRLPDDTVRSLSRSGLLRFWMRIPANVRTLPTQMNLAPGVRLLADGAYCRLAPAGLWTTPPTDADADYQPLPPGWINAAVAQDAPPIPTVRIFTRH